MVAKALASALQEHVSFNDWNRSLIEVPHCLCLESLHWWTVLQGLGSLLTVCWILSSNTQDPAFAKKSFESLSHRSAPTVEGVIYFYFCD